MSRNSRILTLAVATVSLFLLGSGQAAAQSVIVSPARVSYYYPLPVVSYYREPVVYAPAPVVSYYAAPAVSYYGAPAVSYYTPSVSYYTPSVSYAVPAVSYYAAPAGAVTTTRYGLFGRPRVSTVYYYPR